MRIELGHSRQLTQKLRHQICTTRTPRFSANHSIPGIQRLVHLGAPKQLICAEGLTQSQPSVLKQTRCLSLSGRRLLHSARTEPYLLTQQRECKKRAVPSKSHPRYASNQAISDKLRVSRREGNIRSAANHLPLFTPAGRTHGHALLHVSSNRTLNQASRSLPSEHVNRRSKLSTRFNSYMESMLNSIALLSQRLNIYTGTDYSGISALRESIISQEKLVKSRHAKVSEAKEAHTSALAAQSDSHREVVQLLERKHSWSDRDLEHYMALVRSEHTNEQTVQAGKDELSEADRSLEEARVKLEKLERQQYHEEQLWSDTIRRNSTWVTFGLMGLNIGLLLASLVAIEPWRRKRLINEIRKVLDDRSNAPQVGIPVLDAALGTQVESSVENAIPTPFYSLKEVDVTAPVSLVGTELKTNQAAETLAAKIQHATLPAPEPQPEPQRLSMRSSSYTGSWSTTFTLWKAYWVDLFSERRVTIARGDLTKATLEGAAAGAAFMGLVFVFLRPR